MTHQQIILSASLDQPHKLEVAALVITYFPDAKVTERLEKLLEQVDRVAIVDNGSDAASLAFLEPLAAEGRITIQRNGANLGIATALNQGIRQLGAEGYEWIVTFDQDSTVTLGFVPALIASLAADPEPETIAIVGANRCDPGDPTRTHTWLRPKGGIPFFERVPCEQLGSDGATLIITSGSLTSVAAFERIGGFREEMFIDLVDIEYCLRVRRAGFRTIVSSSARLIHRVGTTEPVRVFGVSLHPTHHSPLRKYYLFRNSARVMKEHGGAYPFWVIYHVLALCEIIAGVLLVEKGKLAKLRACLTGAWDGLRGCTGPARLNL